MVSTVVIVLLAAGALQTCAEQDAGAEAAIHAMKNFLRRKTLRLVSSLMLITSLTGLIIKLLFTTLTPFVLRITNGAPIIYY